MQEDSMNFSTSGPVTQDQIITQESPVKSLQCSHCTTLFKSKVYLFEHLNQVHGLDVDSALRDAGLKSTGTNRANTENHSGSVDFKCHHCDFKACGQDVLNEHEKQCNKNSEDQNVVGNLNSSGNPEINITVNSTTQHTEAVSVMSTSKSKCSLNSKDLKIYKRPLQTITKYFAASSGSNGKSPVKLADSPTPLDSAKGTIILQDSASNSSPNSSGVFKVTAMHSVIDTTLSNHYLLNDHFLNSDLRPPKSKEQSTEPVPDNVGKRTNNGSSKCPPAKKAKSDKEETKLLDEASASQQQSPSNKEFSFEVSEDEGERRLLLVNGDTESSKLYFCKHCDYSDAIGCLSTHYQTNHPYVRYNAAYIRDPSDDSATFRCLQCPAEFLSVAYLKRHYTENHPEAPNVFTMQSCELNLVFRCFVCSFTTNALKALKTHYKENHPTHKVDNSLMYCKYSVTGCQEGSCQPNTCENASSPERQGGISPERASTPCKEVRNAPSPQHPTSTGADVALYHCNSCTFSHKSTVVMHVHYQKSHPGEEVTIDKIKQSVLVTSPTTSQMAPDKSPNSVQITEKSTPQMNISDFFKKTKDKAELSERTHTPEASKTYSESPKTRKVTSLKIKSKGKKLPTKRSREMSSGMDRFSGNSPDKLFYCQSCSYSSTNIKSVVSHHNAKHAMHTLTSIEEILVYSAGVQKKKLQSGAQASASAKPSESKTSKQVEGYSEKKLQDEAADALVTNGFNAYACAEKLFYCQKCNYGNASAKGVANHQNQVHRTLPYSKECIIKHTALIRDEIEKSKTQAKEFSFSTRLPLPLMNEGDEDMFFCHFCNYRQSTLDYVMKHYFKKHRGFVVTSEQISLYTSLVREKTQKSHLKTTANQEVIPPSLAERRNERKITRKLDKSSSVSAPPSVTASQTQRTLQCYRCSFSTQYVDVLRRHIWKTHRANRSVTEVLRVCFKQGNLQAGYHCDVCVFSHEKAAAVYEHYQEKHEVRKPSLEFVTNRLYVGPKACPIKRKKPQIKHADGICDGDGTDGSIASQKSEQNDSKTYSCRACSFKGSSVSAMTLHYRAVHPWSMKDDGSVPNVVIRKKPSANRQVEDHDNMPGSFESYQEPLEFEKLPASSPKATASSKMLWCPYCPAKFNSKHGLNVHCGMKHHEAVAENADKQQEQVQKRMHVFKCLHCTYVNTSYQGVLTHCQMKHPALVARADSHHVDEAHSHNWGDCLKIKGPGSSLRLGGYMCETCPQICSTLEKLNKHYKKGHIETVPNIVPNKPKPALKPLVVSKMKQFKTLSNRGSLSQTSFFSMKKYAVVKCQHCSYSCSTKIALSRHLRVHHKNASVSKVQDCVYKCVLCSKPYFKKKRLGSHYIKKHGRDSYLKYFAPVYKHAHEKPAPTSPDRPSPQPENTREACKSNTTTEENKRLLVYKCPSCPYVNASYHGTLTHCQMKHPTVRARADELKTDEILVTNMVNCTIGQSSNERGYVCKTCPLIYASLKKLKKHCERDHDQATAFEHSADIETEKQLDHGSALKALKSKTPAVSTAEISFSHKLGTPETCQFNTVSVQNKQTVYKCHICNYKGFFRRYLQSHYKKNHKLDALTTHKLLEKYNIRKKTSQLPEVESEECAPLKCKKCPELMFDSSQLLVAHYDTFHSSDCILDFTVLSQGTKKGSTGLYRCVHCNKQMNGIRKLWYHLDCHRESAKKRAMAAKTAASLAVTTTSEATSTKVCRQEELLKSETVEEVTHLNVTPVKIFTWPPSPLSSPSKPSDVEQPQLESKEDQHACQQCKRTFRSLKGLRSHERSHAAVAAIKKLNNLPISVLKHNINKYVLYKAGTVKPFRCSFCSYRTTVMGLWRSHFMKTHQDDLSDCDETDNQDEECVQRADKEPFSSSEELNNWPEPDEEQEMTEKSLYLEPPDVQRQLNHYSLMAQVDAPSRTNVPEARLPENSLLHCEFCNFNTGHLSSIRRHYLNRHGKKILRCKDCDFFTGLRKTLEMHMETGHSTCQSEPTHQKDLRCPFCLYQTKNKNNMIDHIVLHREERVVPIEVRRSKLSRYLQGIVFRCHKCTFTSGSADNLRSHMTRHNDIKPYKCRLCYFDCTRLSDLEAHLSDKHQVVRNHELVGQVSLDQLQARVGRTPEEEAAEPLSNLEHHNNDSEDVETEEFVTDCDEVPHETQAKDLAENNTREKMTLQTKEAYQKQGQDGKNDESPAKSSALDLHYEKAKPNTAIQEEHEQHLQEQAAVFLPARPDSEDSSVTFTQQKEEATEESSTYGKTAEKAQTHKLHNEELQHKPSSIDAKLEDNIVRHILLLDEDGSICKTHEEAAQDGAVKTEDIENEVVDNVQSEMILQDEKGTITLANNNPENQVYTEAISAKEEQMQANNSRAQESFTVERHLLTLQPKCAEPKISHKESLGVSFTNCKKEQVHDLKNSKEVRDPYGEMPVLENEYLKEEMQPLGCCKEEDQSDHLEQKQDTEDEMITEDDENRCRKHEEGDVMKEAVNPHVPKGALTVTDGAAEVLCPAATEEKPFTCEFCGRNLMNSSDLERHIMRHGL